MVELLSDLSVGLFQDIEHRGPGCMVLVAVELHDKVDAAAGDQFVSKFFRSVDLGRHRFEVGLKAWVFANTVACILQMMAGFCQLVLLLQ